MLFLVWQFCFSSLDGHQVIIASQEVKGSLLYCVSIDESPRQDHQPDIMLRELRTAMEADHHYKDLVNAVESGFGSNKAHVVDHVRQFWAIRHELSMENGLVSTVAGLWYLYQPNAKFFGSSICCPSGHRPHET